eukprot:TRINITY_DN1819_c0_g1_i4.p1 TRINITY_DN1819_c0_g1~~TRINITY_DN1819_c0_g1_i4.p1  ORF type:complete len:2096 (+),score=234.86 TRINITY_DN1819_c0_g1_i4:133-6420(+)
MLNGLEVLAVFGFLLVWHSNACDVTARRSVSVIIPTFLRPEFLRFAIHEVARQDYPHIKEVVAVDDSPHTLQLTNEELSSLESHVTPTKLKYIALEHQQSIGQKRNIAVSHSSGDVIVHWDDDDIFGTRRVSRQLRPLIECNSNISVFTMSAALFLQSGTLVHTKKPQGWGIHYGTLAYYRSLWGSGAGHVSFRDVSLGEDYAWTEHAVKLGATMTILSPVLEAQDQDFIAVRHGSNSWHWDTNLTDDSSYEAEEMDAKRVLSPQRKLLFSQDILEHMRLRHELYPVKNQWPDDQTNFSYMAEQFYSSDTRRMQSGTLGYTSGPTASTTSAWTSLSSTLKLTTSSFTTTRTTATATSTLSTTTATFTTLTTTESSLTATLTTSSFTTTRTTATATSTLSMTTATFTSLTSTESSLTPTLTPSSTTSRTTATAASTLSMTTATFTTLASTESSFTATISASSSTVIGTTATATSTLPATTVIFTTLTSSTSSLASSSVAAGSAGTAAFSTTVPAEAVPSVPVQCSEGLPIAQGVDVSDCLSKFAGEMCRVNCTSQYRGAAVDYSCMNVGGDGVFLGEAPICTRVVCNASRLSNDFFTDDCTDKSVGEWCILRCLDGFIPASAILTCGSDGDWIGSLPSCERIRCPIESLPPTANSSDCLGKQTLESCNLSCPYGFQGSPVTISCLENGSFSAGAPTCETKRCDVPFELVSARYDHDCQQARHRDSCIARCSQGFEGAWSEWTCLDGTLSGQMPNCTGKPCFAAISEVGIDSSDCAHKTTGETCSLECVHGYEAVFAGGSATCTSSGLFRTNGFECRLAKCGDLSVLPQFGTDAIYHGCRQIPFSTSCIASCRRGYRLQGNATELICQTGPSSSAGYVSTSGTSAEELSSPTCRALPCFAKRPNSLGVQHDCDGRVTGETCSVTSATGYDIVQGSPVTLTCATSGAFVGEPLPVVAPSRCEVPTWQVGVGSTCRNKSLGMDCWAYCKRTHFGRPKRYECILNAQGVSLERVAADINCTLNTSYVPPSRRMEARSLQSSPDNASQDFQACSQDSVARAGLAGREFEHACWQLQHDEICLVHCSHGWNMSKLEPSVFVCDNGSIVGDVNPVCTPMPCRYGFPSGLGVSHDCENKGTLETCTASCNGTSGYIATGSKEELYLCNPSGELRGHEPECVPQQCRPLELPVQFQHDCSNSSMGDSCVVWCAMGFTLLGQPSIHTCLADGSFEGELPTCLANACLDSSLPSAGVELFIPPECKSLTTFETCDVSCQVGYVANSSSFACTASGSIIGSRPWCQPMTCPGLPQAFGIKDNCDDVPYGRTCVVSCDTGFRLTPGNFSQSWVCDWDSEARELRLYGQMPRCEPLPCNFQSASNSLFIDNCTSVKTGQYCVQTCREGYEVQSQGLFTCSKSGLLVGSQPRCLPATCDSPQLPLLVDTCQGIQFGQSCLATCAPGYSAEGGPSKWVCETGTQIGLSAVDSADTSHITLRGSVPRCEPEECLYGLPGHMQFVHDCTGASTGSTCEVGCASGWIGATTSYVCHANRSFSGALPSCMIPLTTPRAATTMVDPREVIVQLDGRMVLAVLNATEFTLQPRMRIAVKRALSNISGLSGEDLNASLQVLPHRLGDVLDFTVDTSVRSRRLQNKDTVHVFYSYKTSASTMAEADELGENLTATLDLVPLDVITQVLRDSITAAWSIDVMLYYGPECQYNRAKIIVGTRSMENVLKQIETPLPPVVQVGSDSSHASLSVAIVALLIGMLCCMGISSRIYRESRRKRLAAAAAREQEFACSEFKDVGEFTPVSLVPESLFNGPGITPSITDQELQMGLSDLEHVVVEDITESEPEIQLADPESVVLEDEASHVEGGTSNAHEGEAVVQLLYLLERDRTGHVAPESSEVEIVDHFDMDDIERAGDLDIIELSLPDDGGEDGRGEMAGQICLPEDHTVLASTSNNGLGVDNRSSVADNGGERTENEVRDDMRIAAAGNILEGGGANQSLGPAPLSMRSDGSGSTKPKSSDLGWSPDDDFSARSLLGIQSLQPASREESADNGIYFLDVHRIIFDTDLDSQLHDVPNNSNCSIDTVNDNRKFVREFRLRLESR